MQQARVAAAIELGLPVDCKLNVDCFIQNYVDVKAGPGARDFMCGPATYDGHKGTDFRLRSFSDIARNISVIAAAPGRVKAIRDGMPDHFFRKGPDGEAIKGKECGNGVLVDHASGWQTQYCHMKRGSVVVRPGQMVKRSMRLGSVGSSGKSQFPHLHLALRRGKLVVDPFTGQPASLGCKTQTKARSTSLWLPELSHILAYPGTTVIEFGFNGTALGALDVRAGIRKSATATSPVLIAFVRILHMRKGDRFSLEFSGPGGVNVGTRTRLLNNKAHYFAFAGKKRKASRWPAGQYNARVTVLRNGRVLIGRIKSLVMP